MIQNILSIIALLLAIYLLLDAFVLPSRKKSSSNKACGIDAKKCGCN